jgi:hypothetical protein
MNIFIVRLVIQTGGKTERNNLDFFYYYYFKKAS